MAHGRSPLRRNDALAWVDDGLDRIALVRLEDPAGPPLVLSGTGAAIFRSVDGQRTDEDIVDVIAQEYDVDPHEIRDQVADFVSELMQQGILS